MLYQIFLSALATCGFGILFEIRGKNLFYASIVGGISWGTYLISLELWGNLILANFIAGLALTLCSEVLSRMLKTPVTSILISGLIPLVPGSGIYYTMYAILERNMERAVFKGTETLFVGLALSFGIVVISSLVKVVTVGNKSRYQRSN